MARAFGCCVLRVESVRFERLLIGDLLSMLWRRAASPDGGLATFLLAVLCGNLLWEYFVTYGRSP